MRYLIDADIVAFKAASSAENPVNWGDGFWTLHSFEDDGIRYCMDYFHRVVERLGDGELCLFLTGDNNWRKDILPTYKGNRKDVRKPLILPALRDWMVSECNAVRIPTLEADDLLGIEATKSGGVIISEDKDLRTIPGKHFNPDKDQKIVEVSEFEADYNHMLQTLTGDTTDGYTGCPSVGPKTAEKILEGCSSIEEMWPRVVEAYAKKKLSEEVALTQARVARICRVSDYDFKTRKVIPWTPPKT